MPGKRCTRARPIPIRSASMSERKASRLIAATMSSSPRISPLGCARCRSTARTVPQTTSRSWSSSSETMMAGMPAIEVRSIGEALGAEVTGVDLARSLAAPVFAQIRQAWRGHLGIRFRSQRLSDSELLAFSRLFGELDPPGPNPYGKAFLPDHPEMNVISNIKADGVPIGGLGDGEAIWHADMTYVDRPPMAALLHALEVPPEGGDTYWANMYLAYETLPAKLKAAIHGRLAVHDATYNSAGMLRKGYKHISDPREAPGARHPLVR